MADVLTGKEGRVKTAAVIASVKEWGISPAHDVHIARSSATREGPVRKPGTEKWAGTYMAFGGLPTTLPGDAFAFTGVISGGITGAREISADAVCNEVVITINYDTGEFISHVVSFQSNGALTFSATGTTALDTLSDITEFVSPAGAAMSVMHGTAAGTYATTLPEVKTVTITLSAANVSRVSSSTAGVELHTPGNIDAKVSISVNEGDPTALLVIGSELALKVFTNATEFWIFDYMVVEDWSDLIIDTESGDIIGVTYELGYSAISIAGDNGQITKPGGGDWYAAAA